jgi:hypothetical protein
MTTETFRSAILRYLFSIFATVSFVVLSGWALIAQEPAATPFNQAEAHAAVENLAKQLEENFIYPKTGKAYAEMLRSKVSSGAYAKFVNAAEFAKTVTADLQAVQPEGHLRLQPPAPNASAGQNAGPAGSRARGVGKSGWLAPKVAYMSYHGFSGNREAYDAVLKKLREVLEGFSTAETLIIDVRAHPGGGLDDMDVMFSYFFDQPTTLVMMDTREEVEKRGGSPLSGHPTLKSVAGPEGIVRRAHFVNPLGKPSGLSKAKIFLLTSRRTASAGEHLTLSLKRTKRAMLIGETTAGAGHFGRTTPLGGGYRAFIPVGRTFDPDTDKGWEQTGIEPDVKVPAEKALDEALKRAGVEAEQARKALETLAVD